TKAFITGDKFVIKRGDQVIAAGTMKLDANKKPKAAEMTYTEGMDSGKTFKGIYEIDGDTVKFCRAGGPRSMHLRNFKNSALRLYLFPQTHRDDTVPLCTL